MSEDKVELSARGRRKTAVARVTLSEGTGEWKINRKSFTEYFPIEALRRYIEQPLRLTNMHEKYDITVTVSGSGVSGQAGAVRHGIARALSNADKTLRGVLKNSGCLTRDARMKERKKAGQPGARKRFQFSKR